MGDVDLKQIRTSAGPIRYRDEGAGEALVFLHGVLSDGRLWERVVPLLSGSCRCLVPDWPLGSHRVAMDKDADLSPDGLIAIVLEFLDALGLKQVTLVGNDTGGALCQLLAARHPERVMRLVLTPCDAYENFPPASIFVPLKLAGALPGGLAAVALAHRLRAVQRLPLSFGGLGKRVEPEMVIWWLEPVRTSRLIRRDLVKIMKSLDKRYSLEAAERLKTFTRPVLIAWAPEARFFTMSYGERLAADIPGARLEQIDDAYTFVSIDQPERTASLISWFLSKTRTAAGT
jgi:pimeloyl-ACP methyl ester carboxylesterase